MDKEFEEEHMVNTKTRIRGAKERAIIPGPRLDRHPSEDDSRDGSGDEAEGPAAKRRRATTAASLTGSTKAATASGAGIAAPSPKSASGGPSASPKARVEKVEKAEKDSPAKQAKAAAASLGRVATVPSPGKSQTGAATSQTGAATSMSQEVPASPASTGGEERHELLFKRVSVRGPDNGEEQPASQKARITAVEGDKVEVITEGSFSTMNLNIDEVHAIDETQFGASLKNVGPTDFGFLMSGKDGATAQLDPGSKPVAVPSK